jgi:peptide/nickel transport system substrate-binding protein
LTRRELGIYACLLCAALSTACRPKSPPGIVKDTVTIGVSLPKVGDQASENTLDRVVGSMKLESAVAIDQNGKPAPRVFDTWKWLEHGLALELHLRPGILFHDGTELKAELAADILRNSLTDPDELHISTIESVVASDDSHVVIRTKRQEGLLFSDLSMIDIELPGKPGVGTGPFKATTDPGVLEAYDRYYLGAPLLRHVNVVEYQSQRAVWTAMMRGEVDLLHEVSREAAEFVEKESSVDSRKFLRSYYDAIVFNMHHPVLSKREVRLALNEAVNRAAIVDVSMRGLGQPANGPVWPQHWAFSSAVPQFPFDPASAARRLDALGLINGRVREPGRMPSRFSFKCLVLENDSRFERIALRVQRELYELGIDMEIVSTKPRAMGAALGTGTFDAALMEFIGSRSLNWSYLFWHSPQTGIPQYLASGYQAADATLDRFRAATSDDEIRSSVEAMQQTFRDDPPALFLAWVQASRALSKAFVVPDEGSGDILGTIRQWRGVPIQAHPAK